MKRAILFLFLITASGLAIAMERSGELSKKRRRSADDDGPPPKVARHNGFQFMSPDPIKWFGELCDNNASKEDIEFLGLRTIKHILEKQPTVHEYKSRRETKVRILLELARSRKSQG